MFAFVQARRVLVSRKLQTLQLLQLFAVFDNNSWSSFAIELIESSHYRINLSYLNLHLDPSFINDTFESLLLRCFDSI